MMARRGGHTDPDASVRDLQADRGVDIRGLRRTDGTVRVPELAPRFRLPGLEEGKVGLVVGEDAGHQLDVGRIFAGDRIGVSEVAVSGVAKFVVAPGPLFLAGAM